jgi:hypothetical protein
VLHASEALEALEALEGGSKRSMTSPPVTPIPLSPFPSPREGAAVVTPANRPPERGARVPSSRFSTLAAATDKIVVSRNVLIGLCLTTFAFGIVTTLAVDGIHARASEASAPREPEPIVLHTTPIEPDVKDPAAAEPAARPAPAPTAELAPAPAAQAAPAPAAQTAPAPAALVAQTAPAPAEATPPAAAEAVVVQLPPASETAPRSVRPSPRATRQVAAAPARPATIRKRASAVRGSDPTEAPPNDGPLPAPVKKKWVDPFGE